MSVAPQGMDQYRRRAEERNKRAKNPDIARAKEVPIHDVLRDFFRITVPYAEGSYKIYCPFSAEHPDGGIDKNTRVYSASNSVYCFAVHGSMDPVGLVMMQMGVPAKVAAQKVLQRYNIPSRAPWRQRYQEVLLDAERRESPAVDPAALVEALHVALAREANYLDSLFSRRLNDVLEERLLLLDSILGSASEEEIREWYRATLEKAQTLLNS